MSRRQSFWRWLWGDPRRTSGLPPPDQRKLDNINQILLDDLDGLSSERRRRDKRYRTHIDPSEIHTPRYDSQEAKDYDPKFDRYSWRQWLLLHEKWPFSMTFVKFSDRHPLMTSMLNSPFWYAVIYGLLLLFIAWAAYHFIGPAIQARIDQLLGIADNIYG